MASTATPDEVRAINGSSLTDTQIEPFLSAASCIIDSQSDCIAAKGIVAICQTIAEAWLAAHLLSVAGVGEKTRIKKRVTFENYTVEWAQSQIQGQGVMSTTYGQNANDVLNGCLTNVGKSPALICSFG